MRTAGRVTLLRRDDLAAEGLDSRAIRRQVAQRRLFAVRPGVYARPVDGAALTPEERMRARAVAWDETASHPPVFSHTTAAALHDLPLWRPTDSRTHVIVPDARPGAADGLVRHRGMLGTADIVEIDGVRVTSLARTVADVARTSDFDRAVAVADAAVRQVSHVRNGVYLQDRAEEFLHTAEEIAHRSAHGRRRATLVLDFADGRAQLPGESVSRVRLVALGFAPPRLQVRVAGPDGADYWVDFGLDDVASFGEFDGKGKYRDLLLRHGLSMEQVLEREKQREDWIRGTTQRRLARWGSEHIATAQALGDRLASFGITPPRRPRA
ncbi:type IV toxin-antitoxin system AbiEi family antitoxin domain-containing protein [Microbacterium sp. RD1]|uniref:type IV toxin-antitoxin system AbiEi family antitoxin domain-containing protein n=1 Tax=Microbacterium sp. RD1 TaxID=3457313 RepID=UPI003FA579B1